MPQWKAVVVFVVFRISRALRTRYCFAPSLFDHFWGINGRKYKIPRVKGNDALVTAGQSPYYKWIFLIVCRCVEYRGKTFRVPRKRLHSATRNPP